MAGEHSRRESDHRSIHEDCTAHSGLTLKANANIILSGVACILLGFLLSLMVDTNSMLKGQEWRMERTEQDVDGILERVAALEQRP